MDKRVIFRIGTDATMTMDANYKYFEVKGPNSFVETKEFSQTEEFEPKNLKGFTGILLYKDRSSPGIFVTYYSNGKIHNIDGPANWLAETSGRSVGIYRFYFNGVTLSSKDIFFTNVFFEYVSKGQLLKYAKNTLGREGNVIVINKGSFAGIHPWIEVMRRDGSRECFTDYSMNYKHVTTPEERKLINQFVFFLASHKN